MPTKMRLEPIAAISTAANVAPMTVPVPPRMETPPTTAAVLLAEFRASPQNLVNELAVLFLIVRIAYVLTYLGDRPTLRTILWNIGFAINLGIFFMPAIRGFFPV